MGALGSLAPSRKDCGDCACGPEEPAKDTGAAFTQSEEVQGKNIRIKKLVLKMRIPMYIVFFMRYSKGVYLAGDYFLVSFIKTVTRKNAAVLTSS